MVHGPPPADDGLPADWQEQVGRAYLTFGVESFLREDTELGFRSMLRGAQEYWTTARRRAKAERQLRDPESKQWIEQRAGIPTRQARAAIGVDHGEVDELDLPAGRAPRFRLPEINPGLSQAARNAKVGHRGIMQQVVPVPAPSAMAVSPEILEKMNELRAEEGLPPFMVPDGTWANNGADLRTLSDDVVQELLERLRVAKEADPRAAGTIEEMTANIIDAFKAASPEEQAHGEQWYAMAAQEALDLAEEYGVDPHVVAALLASTSPRTEWESNLAAVIVALESLLPDRSPRVDDNFLGTRMTQDTDLDNKKLKPGEKPPTGLDYILGSKAVRESFAKKHPRGEEQVTEINPATGRQRKVWVPTESEEDWEQRITDTIIATLQQRNPDGSPLQMYQYRDQKLRAALMDINNRVLGEKQAATLPEGKRRPGMGLQVPQISSDGHVQYERLKGFSKILAGNVAAIDRLFGYDTLDQMQHHLPEGWNGLPTDEVDLYHRIDETLGGHKTRSFYNNIITHGQSDFATIDVHALRAALLGKAATRSGVSVPGAEALLENPKFLPKDVAQQMKDEKRIGVYAVVNEAFRLATEQLNVERAEAGLPPLTTAQVQAVAWIAARPESIGSDFTGMAMQERDPGRVAARVLPQLPPEQQEKALELIGTARGLQAARRQLATTGIDPDSVLPDDAVGAERFRRANAAARPMLEEFKRLKGDGTMNLNAGELATAAWLSSRFDSDEEVAERMEAIFAEKGKGFTPADAALIRQMLSDRYTKDELLAGAGRDGIQSRLDAYNERRRMNGIYGAPLTYDQFLQFLRTGDYT